MEKISLRVTSCISYGALFGVPNLRVPDKWMIIYAIYIQVYKYLYIYTCVYIYKLHLYEAVFGSTVLPKCQPTDFVWRRFHNRLLNLIKLTEIWLYLLFSDWFGTKLISPRIGFKEFQRWYIWIYKNFFNNWICCL